MIRGYIKQGVYRGYVVLEGVHAFEIDPRAFSASDVWNYGATVRAYEVIHCAHCVKARWGLDVGS